VLRRAKIRDPGNRRVGSLKLRPHKFGGSGGHNALR
jgi:hypothetical protein